jgi:hypothetical protein
MEKTAKITRTTFKNVWTNPQGGQIFYHDIELDNGDKGNIGSKEQMPAKLNPGNELTYTIEVTDKGTKIKAVTPAANFNRGGGKPQINPQVQMIGFAMSYTKDLIVGGKVQMIDLEKEFNRIYTVMTSKL